MASQKAEESGSNIRQVRRRIPAISDHESWTGGRYTLQLQRKLPRCSSKQLYTDRRGTLVNATYFGVDKRIMKHFF